MRLLAPALSAILLSSCVFVINESSRERATETRSFSFDAAGAQIIEIDTYNGFLQVDAGPAGSTEVQCEAKFYATGKTQEEATSRLAEMKVISSRDGDRLQLEVPRHSILGTNNVGASLILTLPEGVEVDLRSSNGSVTLDAPFAKPVIHTSNGNVLVRAASGPISVQSSNGRVDIVDAPQPGKVEVKTSNGGITYVGASRDFKLVTGNGPVQLELPDGWDGNGYIHSSNSNVRIKSDGKILTKLTASTSNGKIMVDGPPLKAEGGSELRVETSNGSVHVEHVDR